jgi:hypothetical protein
MANLFVLRLLLWGCIAGFLASFDQFHLASGLMNHADNWVDKVFPWWLSPNYMVGGFLFYLLFHFMFEGRNGSNSKALIVISPIQTVLVVVQHCLVYAISFFLCNYKIVYVDHNEIPYPNLPFVIFQLYSGVLFIQTLLSKKEYAQQFEKILLYCIICATLGLSFEWLSSILPFGFKHQPCWESPGHWTCTGTR